MQHKVFCGLYTASAQGMLSSVSEKRVANEFVNRALELSLLQHSDDTMVIVKHSYGEDQQPLIILRRGYSQNLSSLHQPGLRPSWWREEVFSRNFQLPQSQYFELIHQRMHNRHHFLFFNRAQSFLNPLNDFLPPVRPNIELRSAMAVRFCLNDAGLQMPDNGLSIFTTLVKVKLTCRVKIPLSQNMEAFNSPLRYQKDEPFVDFDHIVTSGSFVGVDKDLYFVGLFVSSDFSRPLEERLRGSLGVLGLPLALCIFRRADLDSLLSEAPLVVQMPNEPIKRLLAANHSEMEDGIELSRYTRINKTESYLNSFQRCIRTNKHVTIKGVFAEEIWKPTGNGEALAIIQTKKRFVAMLVGSVDSLSDLPRRRLTQGREICLLYLLTESSNLMVFLVSKRDLFQSNDHNSKADWSTSNMHDLLLTGGMELLFFVILSPALAADLVQMEFTAFREIAISDRQRLVLVDLNNCFTASFYDRPGFANAKYLSVGKETETTNTEVFNWRTVKLACHVPRGTITSNSTFPLSQSSGISMRNTQQLLPIIWVLSALSFILATLSSCLILAYIRSKRSYLRKINSLQEITSKGRAHYHLNTFHDQKLTGDVVNASKRGVLLDLDCPFAMPNSSGCHTLMTNPFEIVSVSEPHSKILTFPVFSAIPSQTKHIRQLNNDLELRTFKITPNR